MFKSLILTKAPSAKVLPFELSLVNLILNLRKVDVEKNENSKLSAKFYLFPTLKTLKFNSVILINLNNNFSIDWNHQSYSSTFIVVIGESSDSETFHQAE